MSFSNILKNLFWVLLILQVAPTLIKSIKTQYSSLLETKTKVGVIPFTETIYKSDTYVKNIKKFFEDDEIKAIILKIDSPGGAAASSQHVFNEIKAYKNKYKDKYVIAFVENVAGSGGYYIASAADYIIAAPASFIGSIGSYIAHPNFKNLMENYKVKYEVIKSGDYKTAGNPFLDMTDDQRKMMQSLSDNVYEQFVKDVAAQRKEVSKDTKVWANGKIFTGQQAFELKLIDELGSQSSVNNVLRQRAKIAEKIEWVTPKKREGLLAALMGQDDDSNQEFSMNSLVNNVCSVLESRYGIHAQF